MPGRVVPVLTISNEPMSEASDQNPVSFRDYTISRRLGKGRFSVVFQTHNVVCNDVYAIKVLLPGRRRVRREARILSHLRDGPNIVRLMDILADDEGDPRAFVLEAIDVQDFRVLFPRFRITDIRYYTAELLRALKFCHEQGVIHRDIRPHNIVINHHAKQLRLVGWGSATFHQPQASHTVCISHFKAPELLVGWYQYDYSLDMWGAGTILASMIFRKEPLFYGCGTADILGSMTKILGTDGLFEFLRDFNLELDRDIVEAIGIRPRRPWSSLITNENQMNANDEAIDLVEQLLRYNPVQRLSAKQALDHAFLT